MSRSKKSKLLPVSERQLAAYLGISKSLMNMAEGKSLSRSLPAVASKKLADLYIIHINPGKSKRAGSSIQPWQQGIRKKAGPIAKKMLSDAEFFASKAKELQRMLDEKLAKQTEQLQWLNTINQLMDELPGKEEQKEDHGWLSKQQSLTTEKLHNWNLLEESKLRLQVELLKASSGIYRSAYKKLIKAIS